MEQKGVENPERFIQDTNQIPIEVQQALLQDPKVQLLIKGFMDRQAGQVEAPQQPMQEVA